VKAAAQRGESRKNDARSFMKSSAQRVYHNHAIVEHSRKAKRQRRTAQRARAARQHCYHATIRYDRSTRVCHSRRGTVQHISASVEGNVKAERMREAARVKRKRPAAHVSQQHIAERRQWQARCQQRQAGIPQAHHEPVWRRHASEGSVERGKADARDEMQALARAQ